MNNLKKIIFFISLLLLCSCSIDNKTGIWSDAEKEKKKIAKLKKKQKERIETEQIVTSENIYNKLKTLNTKIILSQARKTLDWEIDNENNQNLLSNIHLSSIENKFLKKKIGKNKFKIHGYKSSLLIKRKKIIFTDDTGTVFNINKSGKVNWKTNIYKKLYKRVYKNLVLSISDDVIFVADNIGFIYAINLNNGKLNWVKNYGIPIKSNIKVYKNKIFLIDQDNKIICLNTKDGSLIWDIRTIPSFIKFQNLLSVALSKDGNLFVVTSSADVFKISSSNGNVVWSRNTAESLYANATDFFKSSNIVVDDEQVILSSGSSIFSFDEKFGENNWKAEVSSIATPIIDSENIFLVTEKGYFSILDKRNGEILSSSNILNILKKKHRETKVEGFIMGSGKIYSLTTNGYLITSSALTGKAQSFKKVGDKIRSPLIISDNSLYLLTETSKIIGFN